MDNLFILYHLYHSYGLKQAQYIMANIVKSNMHKMNLVSATASICTKKEEEPKTSRNALGFEVTALTQLSFFVALYMYILAL